MHAVARTLTVAAFCLASLQAAARDWSDAGALPAAPPFAAACGDLPDKTPLSLRDVVDHTLCRNPKSRLSWANARYQAAQVGVAQAPFLPVVGASAAVLRNQPGRGADYNSLSTDINLSYLLYDFGGRDAALESASQLFAAAIATQDSVVQTLFLTAIQGYYQVSTALAAQESAREAERAAAASLDAATARNKAGVATPADRLQAQTAYSQAVLNRIRAGGDLSNARGNLANLMGLDADHEFELQASAASPAVEQFQRNVGELILEARSRRPDLAAAEAQVKAAHAGVDTATAAGKPSISLTTDLGFQDAQFANASHSGAIGLNVTIPLFTGYASHYRIRAAEAQASARQAERDQLHLQIALDVWRAYQSLSTETQSVQSSADLVKSAAQNAEVAYGRYRAGVGNIIDLITAQSALASARSQEIQARFNWDIARAALAFAIGQLGDSNVLASLK